MATGRLTRLKGFLSASGILLISTMVASIGNYFYQFLMSRTLTPAEYGLFSSLLSLLTILAIPTSAISLIATRRSSRLYALQRSDSLLAHLAGSLKPLTTWIAVGFVIFLLFSSTLQHFLHVPSLFPVLIVGVVAALSLFTPLIVGTLQGFQEFLHVGVNNIVSAVAKIGVGGFLLYAGFKVHGALGGVLAASLATVLIGAWSIWRMQRRMLPSPSIPAEENAIVADEHPWAVFLAYACLTVLANADLMIARHFLHADVVGFYSVVTLVGKILLFLPLLLVPVLQPKVAAASILNQNTRPYLILSLGLATLISSPGLLLCFVAPGWLISTLFGAKYAVSEYYGLLALYSTAMLLLAWLNILTSYYLSKHSIRIVWGLLLGTVSCIVAMVLFHSTPLELAFALLGGEAIVLFSAIALGAGKRLSKGSLQARVGV